MGEHSLERPLAEILRDLDAGAATSAALTEAALDRARDEAGEGARVFLKLYPEQARAAAAAADGVRKSGVAAGPLAGLPISIKDLFDVAGDTTMAGTRIFADRPPAARDAIIVRWLRAAGAVIVGRTNMTELAYSGIGMNTHHGTPANPWDRENRRIPGGSSSGAAVSVADGMAAAAIGTDTAGSIRIPPALCGLVGFKPTARRVPLDGCYPLSSHLDSIGPVARSVACCALLDAVMAGGEPSPLARISLEGLRLALPRTVVLDGLDDHVAVAFERAIAALKDAGAIVTEIAFAELGDAVEAQKTHGTFQAAEAYANHRELIETRAREFDPLVLARVAPGGKMSAADFILLVQARSDLIARSNRVTAPFDAVVMPTVPRVAPPIAELDGDFDRYVETNLAMLRNTGLGNFLDRCAVTLPVHRPGDPPVGLMLMGEAMADRRLLEIAAAVERTMSSILEK